MARHSRPTHTPEQRVNLLDIRLLDLFAEMESLLRLGREIQRHAIALRGGDGEEPPANRRRAIKKIRDAVRQIERDHKSASTVVSAMRSAAMDLE